MCVCSVAPCGLSAEPAPAWPLAACTGPCRQLLAKQTPAPASLWTVTPSPGREAVQAALLLLQESQPDQWVTLQGDSGWQWPGLVQPEPLVRMRLRCHRCSDASAGLWVLHVRWAVKELYICVGSGEAVGTGTP